MTDQEKIDRYTAAAKVLGALTPAELRDPYPRFREIEYLLSPIKDDDDWTVVRGLIHLRGGDVSGHNEPGLLYGIQNTRIRLLCDARILEFWQGRRPIHEDDPGLSHNAIPATCRECKQPAGSLHLDGCPCERCPDCGDQTTGECACLAASLGHIVTGVLANRG